MRQIGTVWASLGRRKQFSVAGAAIVVFVGVLAISRLATSPSMTLLYSGLESGAAGDIVRVLDQRGVAYEIRGGSIYVPGRMRDELRMTLASEGMPATGNRGYELLDSLSGFGTTSQMFDAAYWRAKEGELARTIVSSPYVGQARVHIASGSANPFQRNVSPTASVYLVPSGSKISTEQAKAIRFLVSSAVTGLAPDDVAVIDSNGSVIGPTETATASNTADDKAQVLRNRVLRLIEARVGHGNAVVEVSVDTVTETESIRERRFDPKGRVAISTDVEERSDNARNQSSDVTVASNLPDGDGSGSDESNSSATQTRERVNYEVSETELEVHRVPGAIKRLTVAVLVNGTRSTDAEGNVVFEPMAQEELDALQELVASAVGFDADRGDAITLKSMDFPAAEPKGTLATEPGWLITHLDTMSLIQMGVLAVVSLVMGLFVIRPILTSAAPVGGLPPPADVPGAGDASYLVGEISDVEGQDFRSLPSRSDQGGAVPEIAADKGEDAVGRLRAMIGGKQEETVEILRNWLEESEEQA